MQPRDPKTGRLLPWPKADWPESVTFPRDVPEIRKPRLGPSPRRLDWPSFDRLPSDKDTMSDIWKGAGQPEPPTFDWTVVFLILMILACGVAAGWLLHG